MTTRTMINPTDRITRMLLRRLDRKATLDAYERAEALGLLTRTEVHGERLAPLLVWGVSERLPLLLSGQASVDAPIVKRFLTRRPAPASDAFADLTMDDDAEAQTIGHTFEGRPVTALGITETERPKVQSASPKGSTILPRIGRNYLLRLVRSCRARLSVPDAAVCLLIARAAGESLPDLSMLLDVLRRQAPVVVVRVPVPELEQRFGRMLEKGLVLPFRVNMLDAFGDRTLSGRYRDNASDPHRVTTMSGKTLGSMSAQSIREAIARTAMHKELPLLVADETGSTDFPGRLLAAADLVLETGGVDRGFLAELLHVCLDFAPKVSLAAMEVNGFRLGRLGLDDLTLALRPGRSLEKILSVLAALSATDDADGDDHDGENGGVRSRKVKNRPRERLRNLSRGDEASSFELTQPQPRSLGQVRTEAEVDDNSMVGKEGNGEEGRASGPSAAKGRTSADRYLSVETLSGYGPARDWALDLKTDLALWQQGDVLWSDMSTKLLLSGPPGTGKTTFARALCNSLQIPMLATSLSSMLEPGYLGDVLKAMSAAFETAREHAPSILFIDEIDNVGKRSSGGDKNAEYWNSLINRMLELLDGVGETQGVIVMAATNYPDRIDPALLRSGRLETRIDIPLPDTTALVGILEHHLGSDLATVIGTKPKFEGEPRMTGAERARSNVPKTFVQGGNVSVDRRGLSSTKIGEPKGGAA